MRIIFICFLFFIAYRLDAQYFEKALPGLGFNRIGNMEYTLDDNLLISGERDSGFYFVKIDLVGDTMWSRNIIYNDYNFAAFSYQLPNGSFYIVTEKIDSAGHYDSYEYVFDSTLTNLINNSQFPRTGNMSLPFAARRSLNRNHVAVATMDNDIGPSNEWINIFPGWSRLYGQSAFYPPGISIADNGLVYSGLSDPFIYGGLYIENINGSDTLPDNYYYPAIVAEQSQAYMAANIGNISSFTDTVVIMQLSPACEATPLNLFIDSNKPQVIGLNKTLDGSLLLIVHFNSNGRLGLIKMDLLGNFITGYITSKNLTHLFDTFREAVDSSIALLAQDENLDPYLIRVNENLSNGNQPGITLSDSILCSGDSIHLSVSTAAGVMWSTGDSTQSIVVHVPGFYWASIEDSVGNIQTTPMVYIRQSNVSSDLLGNDTILCAPGLLTLDPGSFSTYLWQDSTTNQTFAVTSPGFYSVTVWDGSCMGSDTVNINFHTPLNTSLGPDTILCTGQAIELYASNNFLYHQWSNGSLTDTISISSLLPGIIDVSINGTDSNLCQVSDTIQITFTTCAEVSEIINESEIYFDSDNRIIRGNGESTTGNFRIFTNEGKLIRTGTILKTPFEINVGNLSSGIYTFQIPGTQKAERAVLKFIVR